LFLYNLVNKTTFYSFLRDIKETTPQIPTKHNDKLFLQHDVHMPCRKRVYSSTTDCFQAKTRKYINHNIPETTNSIKTKFEDDA